MTPFAVLFAFFMVGALLAIAVFAVTQDDAETERAERDAINRKVAAIHKTEGTILHLRRGKRIP